MFPFDDKEMLTNYIVGFAKSCMQARDVIYNLRKTRRYIAITTPDTNIPFKAVVTFCP